MRKYLEFIKEHKLWGKSIPEFLSWLDKLSDKHFVFYDSETTGLPHQGYEIQLTQISCIVARYDFINNTFEEVDTFNKKIKLTSKTSDLMKDPKHKIHWVLNFNHYDSSEADNEETDVVNDFFELLKKYDRPVLVIQNAEFDMRYLNSRNPIIRFNNEILDTKQIIQLFYLPSLLKLSESEEWAHEMINKIGTSDRDNGLVSSSMSKIGPALNIDMNGYHDALTDCRITIEMLQKMVSFLKEHQDLDISKYQSERIKTKR
jgi:hypothetical protein